MFNCLLKRTNLCQILRYKACCQLKNLEMQRSIKEIATSFFSNRIKFTSIINNTINNEYNFTVQITLAKSRKHFPI